MVMKIRLTADEHKALPAHFQSEYAKRDDGLFYLQGEGVDGWKIENVQALTTALERERENAGKATRELKALQEMFKDLDAGKAREALDRVSKLDKGGSDPTVEARIQALTEALEGKFNTEKTALAQKVTQLSAQLQSELVQGTAKSAIAANGGNIELLLPHVARQIKLVELDGGVLAPRVVDEKGNVRISMNHDNNGPMTVAELVAEMSKSKTYSVAFSGKGGKGSGTPPADGGGPDGSSSDVITDPNDPRFSVTAIAKLRNTNPELYSKAMEALKNRGQKKVGST